MADAVNVSDLDHLWDPKATPLFTVKPPEWVATYLPRYCQSVSDRADSDCRGLALVVRELQRDGFWERMFPDWDTCCQALFQRPAAWVEQVVEGVRVLHAQGHQGEISKEQALSAAASQAQPFAPVEIGVEGGKAGPGRGNKTVADSHGFKPASKLSSDSQERILRRLARDAPEILERVKAGEFRSARAAAIEAGIIKPVPTVRLTADIPAVATRICQHLTPEQLDQLVSALRQHLAHSAP